MSEIEKRTENKATTEQATKKHIRCRYGMKCKFLRKYMKLLRMKEHVEIPETITSHIHKFKHPRINICRYHYTSIPESKCKHIHLGDTDEIMKYKLCYHDIECNNPNCKWLHGWNCPYGIICKNPTCPLIHPIIKDPAGNIVDDRRRHIVNQELFGNYPKFNKDKDVKEFKKEEKTKETKNSK